MAATTLIRQTLTVKRVFTKEGSRFGKASILVPLNGKDEFLGLNDGVDENAFKDGGTYDLEISISKTGRRYVNKVLGAVAGEAAPTVDTHAAPVPSVTAGLDRETRISLMNIGNIAGHLSAGDATAFIENFKLVKAHYKEEGII